MKVKKIEFYDSCGGECEQWYQGESIFGTKLFIYSQQVKDHCDTYGGYWMIDMVASYWPMLMAWNRRHEGNTFLLFTWIVKNGKATFTVAEDSGADPIVKQKISFTDLPHSVKLYWDNGRLEFPSEY